VPGIFTTFGVGIEMKFKSVDIASTMPARFVANVSALPSGTSKISIATIEQFANSERDKLVDHTGSRPLSKSALPIYSGRSWKPMPGCRKREFDIDLSTH
jgi:hypothetical protein